MANYRFASSTSPSARNSHDHAEQSQSMALAPGHGAFNAKVAEGEPSISGGSIADDAPLWDEDTQSKRRVKCTDHLALEALPFHQLSGVFIDSFTSRQCR